MTIGERIKVVRKKHGLTQTQLSEMTYISRSHISRVENGFEKPSKRLIKLVSVALNVEYDWLMYGQEKDEKKETFSLSEKMKAIRVENGLSIDEVAEKMTVSESYVFRVENGFEKPSEMYIALFCLTFGVEKEKLLGAMKKCG